MNMHTVFGQLRNHSFKVGRAQSGLLTALIRFLNVLLEYFDFFKIFIGRAQPTFGWAWTLPGPPLATPLYLGVIKIMSCGSKNSSIKDSSSASLCDSRKHGNSSVTTAGINDHNG